MDSIEYQSLKNRYDITVCIITYNREKYIKQAIDSVLNQKTNLKIEILVGDNCSQDSTIDILKGYWESNPNIFHLILNRTNLGITKNRFYTMQHAKGDYIVMLDGDDYWIDQNKIENQYNWLKSHENFIGVATAYEARYSDELIAQKILPSKFMRNRKITLEDFLNGYTFSMTGMLFPKSIFENNYSHFEKMIKASEKLDDGSFCVLFLMLGDVYNLDNVTSVYRIFRPNVERASFNSSNSALSLREKSLMMWNNLDALTNFKFDFGYRIALVIVGALYDLTKHKMSLREYKKLTGSIESRYKQEYKRYMVKALWFKINSKLKEK